VYVHSIVNLLVQCSRILRDPVRKVLEAGSHILVPEVGFLRITCVGRPTLYCNIVQCI